MAGYNKINTFAKNIEDLISTTLSMRQNSKTNNLIRVVVVVGDFLILNILYIIYLYLYRSSFYFPQSDDIHMYMAIANISMAIAQYFYSTVIHNRRSTPEQVLRQVTYLVSTQTAAAYLIMAGILAHDGKQIPNVAFQLCFFPLLYFGILASRYFERRTIKRCRAMGRNIRTLVFVGNDNTILSVYDNIVDNPSTGFVVKGYYADSKKEDWPEKFCYKGTLDDLDRDIKSNNVADELYCCLPSSEKERIKGLMHWCNNNLVHFYYIPAISQIFGQTLKMVRIGTSVAFTNYYEPLMIPSNKLIKRLFDILVSAAVLLVLLPFIPLIAIIIKVQSPGPIFFKQLRTGLDGQNFYCYKFRSMHVNKDADKVQATENDPRKFAFGNIMRKANIDELPQFLNVLKGDMSIVGPRPHMLHHTEVYRQLIDKYMVRHFVKPGITGWAQVTGFRGETKELWQMEGRVKRDIWYIENWSIWLDLRIIWKTAIQVFIHDKNAY